MGNTQSEKGDAEFEAYIDSMNHVRKEHSDNLGRDIDLYRPENLEFEENLVLLIELSFDESEHPGQDQNEVVRLFKQEVNLRKNLKCRNLTQLLFVSYKILSGLCMEKLVCRLVLEYSEENLYKVMNDRQMFRSNMSVPELPSEAQFRNFLGCMVEGLFVLDQHNMQHGYVQPVNILVYNKGSQKPLYKLIDVSLMSKYKKWLKKQLR